jgi:hypothetical protein
MEGLSLDELQAELEQHFRTSRSQFLKLETLPTYIEQDEPSLDAALAGNWSEARRILAEEFERATEELVGKPSPACRSRRLRLYDMPLSDYLRWELITYRESTLRGEEIRVLPRSEYRGVQRDLILFESEVMFELVHDADGNFVCALRETNAPVLAAFAAEFEREWGRARPYTNLLMNLA